MNRKFPEVTLIIFFFFLDIFCTTPARKFGIIDITHEASFYLLYFDFVNEIW